MVRKISISVIALLMFFVVAASDLMATCKSGTPILFDSLCWRCMFPVYVAGMGFGRKYNIENYALNYRDEIDKAPICICMKGPIPVPGIPLAWWEVTHIMDACKDSMCFPSLGLSVSAPFVGYLEGGHKDDGMTYETNPSMMYQSHMVKFIPRIILGFLEDMICLRPSSGIDIAYLSEVDPSWQDPELASILNPEVYLVANPLALSACIADAVTSNVPGLPNSALFWCAGSWGSIPNLTGQADNANQLDGAARIATRMMYKLGREGVMWENATSRCTPVPMPILRKEYFQLQLAKPATGPMCFPIGRSEVIWGSFMNPPSKGSDNFAFVVWSKIRCCAL